MEETYNNKQRDEGKLQPQSALHDEGKLQYQSTLHDTGKLQPQSALHDAEKLQHAGNLSEAEQLALDIMTFSRSQLLIRLRFLETAFLQLSLLPDPEGSLATDGIFIYYNFHEVLKRFQLCPELVSFDYLHMVMHCLFHHPFVGPSTDRIAWDTAADIAVCAAILELDLPYVKTPREEKQKEMLEALKKDVPYLTAEKLYHFFREIHCSPERLLTLRELFSSDDHEKWYTHALKFQDQEAEKNPSDEMDSDTDPSGQDAAGEKDEKASQDGEQSPAGDDASGAGQGSEQEDDFSNALAPSDEDAAAAWRDISGRVKTDLETMSREYGEKAGTILRSIKEVIRERVDYREFLSQFCAPREVLKTSEEEFDYIYYTYGLQLYHNIPLVEPLEYSDQKRIQDFVIVIDTSASVSGEPVRRFLTKTWNLLKSTETFLHTVNVHVIQCDAAVQQDTLITQPEEFDHFLDGLQLKGFGGTDYRPAFEYVSQLKDQGEFTDLAGLLYFTDGEGIYPEDEPDFKTAFIFLEDNYDDKMVPLWAIKHILWEEEETR